MSQLSENQAGLTTAAANDRANSNSLPFLRTEKLSLSYGSKPAFANVTLDIAPGAITALIGPSGCGKTSFLNCLNRLTDLIPLAKVSGRITLGSLDVLDPRTDVLALRRRIGMIFQKPNPFPLSIRKNLEFPLREHGVRVPARVRNLVQQSAALRVGKEQVQLGLASEHVGVRGGLISSGADPDPANPEERELAG